MLVYTPTNGCVCEDVFTFKVSDGDRDSAVATCRVQMVTNTPPTASSSSITVARGRSTTLYLSAWDPNTSPVAVTVFTPPARGAWRYRDPASYPTNSTVIIYTPTNGVATNDVFTFKASDGQIESAVATCTVTIVTNSPPVANSQSVTATAGSPVDVYLSASDPNTPVTELACTIVVPPTNGSWHYRTPSTWPTNSYAITYLPAVPSGADSLLYQASDGSLTSATAT